MASRDLCIPLRKKHGRLANNLLEDQSQIESSNLSLHESGPCGTFVGVYDGHGGPETSRFINDHLFQHLKRFTSEQQSMSADVIRKAFQATEEGFLSVVTRQWPMKPQIAAVGSCCLVGVVCGGFLYIANFDDSRAVLGRAVKATGEVLAIQLSSEHNACIESVRQELHSLHPDDSNIVVLKHNVWHVKGLIQVIILLHKYLIVVLLVGIHVLWHLLPFYFHLLLFDNIISFL
nr:probable protein phosphatase 2C 46 [Ziziphus jujuba var. spinosa]